MTAHKDDEHAVAGFIAQLALPDNPTTEEADAALDLGLAAERHMKHVFKNSTSESYACLTPMDSCFFGR